MIFLILLLLGSCICSNNVENCAESNDGASFYDRLFEKGIQLTEDGWIPDSLIRMGIRSLLEERLVQIHHKSPAASADILADFVQDLQDKPIALVPELANEQHYEVSAKFYETFMGARRKYSSCFWNASTETLDQAEDLSLQLTCEHADLHDGQHILELGCGWGSLTLFMAQRYPNSKITAVSNSNSQREFIMGRVKELGLNNVQVFTKDMNVFETEAEQFDRVVSVEMFEHMRNWPLLFSKIANWLKPNGKFFMHIFVHRSTPYLYLVTSPSDWMSKYFFSGGMMPSDNLPLHFQDHLSFIRMWRWNGKNYEKTLNTWLNNFDTNQDKVWPILKEIYGVDQAKTWFVRWRLFFMACAELFGFNDGAEWYVSHYVFKKR